MANLAVNGGKAVRTKLLPYGRQTIDESDIKAVSEVLRSDWITRGPAVDAFERGIADAAGMPYCVAFSSATAALHAVMALHGVDRYGTVITSPNTFAATSNSVLYCGGKVQFSDIDSKTMNLDPRTKTDWSQAKVVVPVDYAGNPCDYDEFLKLKKKHNFKLVDDASHSLGATYRGKPVGSLCDQTIFSFHPVKPVTTGEGGAVVTHDSGEADFLRQFRSHGIVRTQQPGLYWQELLGFNYNMTDIQAALGVSQLKRLPQFISRRREIAQAYDEHFRKSDLFEIPQVTEGAESGWHLYPLRLNLDKLTVARDEFLKALVAENIGANVHYIPVYWHPYYERMGFARGNCPKAEREYWRTITLPIFPGMNDQDVRDVCTAIDKLSAAYRKG